MTTHPITYEARCRRCGETFCPVDEHDLEHVLRDDETECGGTGDLLGEYHAFAAEETARLQAEGIIPQGNPVGRPYSPTDLGHPLIGRLGERVAYLTDDSGDAEAILANVHADGTVALTDERDIVVAIVPADRILPSHRNADRAKLIADTRRKAEAAREGRAADRAGVIAGDDAPAMTVDAPSATALRDEIISAACGWSGALRGQAHNPTPDADRIVEEQHRRLRDAVDAYLGDEGR